MAKTREWGSRFDALKAHVGAVSTAVAKHNDELKKEAGTHQHAFGRHGWQTGWEAQIVRAAAGETPDSAADPYGLNPTLRTWGQVIVAAPGGLQIKRYGLGDRGQRVVTGFGDEHVPLPNHEPPNKGCRAGQFISPMAQQAALAAARAKLQTRYGRFTQGERRKGAQLRWVPVKRVVIITGAGNTPLGLSFAWDNTSGAPPRSPAETRWLIDAFQRGFSVKQVMNGCPFSGAGTRNATRAALMDIQHVNSVQNLGLHNDDTAFPQIGDLCNALGVKVSMMKRTLSVWDWDLKDSQWKLVTCYATDDAREHCEYTLDGSKKKTGAATGKLKGASTTTGAVQQGKVYLT